MVESEPNSANPERTLDKSGKSSGPSDGSNRQAESKENQYPANAIGAAFKKKLGIDDEADDPDASMMGEGQEGTNICEKHNIPLNFWSNKEQVY